MTEYICYCCDYSTKIRTHYQRHLATKKHIKNAHQENEKGTNKSLYTTISPQNTTFLEEKGIKSHIFTTKNHTNTTKKSTNQKYTKNFDCPYCSKSYSRIDSLNRHIKDFCKAKKEKDLEDEENQKEIVQLKNQIDRLIDKVGNKTQHITNIDNINNSQTTYNTENNIKDNTITNTTTTNNNLNLNVFGKENMDMVTDEIKKEMIKGPFKMMPKLLQMIYFNKDHPENHTMKLVNKNKEVMKIYDKDGWKLVDKKDTIDYVLEDKNYAIDSYFEENEADFSKFIKKIYNNFRRLFDNRDKELWKQIKRDVDLLLWNNM
jgi:hypothetical protein